MVPASMHVIFIMIKLRVLTFYSICSLCPLKHFEYYIHAININIIPHLHNLFLFQCDVTRSLNRYEARSKLFIDQGRTTLYRLFRYIGQYRRNAVLT